MSEEEIQKAWDACETDTERDALIRSTGDDFKNEGRGVMDAETLETILRFCDIAVQTTLTSLARSLNDPRSPLRALDAEMMLRIARNPPPIVRESVFNMLDMMGLTIGDPDADPEMTDAALTAILDGEA